VPPLDCAWKNWPSSNSQASPAWAEEHRLDFRVLAPDSLQREEEEALREPALRLVHAARDVEREMTAALVAGVERLTSCLKRRSSFVMERDPGADLSWIALLFTASLMFFSGQGASGAALVPAFADVVGIVEARAAPRLELGELKLLPQASRRSRRSSARRRT